MPLPLAGPALAPDGSAIVTSVPSDVVSATLGLRYSYGDTLLVSLESWYELQTGVLELSEADRPALLFGGPHRAGIALLARYVLDRVGLTFEVTALTELVNPGYVIAPQIAYRVGDHLRIFAGANIFGGEAGSTGGTYDPNDQVFVGLQGYL